MTTQEIQRLRATQPFESIRILTADGRQYDVRHGRLVSIAMRDHFVTLDLLLVTGIERPIPQKQTRPRRKAS